MASWLLADATLADFRALDANQTHQVCFAVLEDLRAWLRDDDPGRVVRARAALGGLRARLLARSYLIEHLKQESYLDTRTREEERAVVGLLDTFFADGTTFPQGLALGLPSTGHADQAGADKKPPER